MHDRLFENNKSLGPNELPKHAEALKLNPAPFLQCLESGRFAADIRTDITEANSAGVTGTPTFLIGLIQPNGTVKVVKKLVGAKPYAEFKAAFRQPAHRPGGCGNALTRFAPGRLISSASRVSRRRTML